MSKYLIAAVAASALLLPGCGSGTAVKREPGSWTQKVDIVRLEGGDANAKAKLAMQRMFDSLSFMSTCLTPAAAAKEDVAGDLATSGGVSCKFDRRSISGEALNLSGICGNGAHKARISARGTSGATAQDIVITIEAIDKEKNSPGAQLMEMHMTSKRGGDCTARDITPPVPAAS